METLPPVVKPSDIVGAVTAKAAGETGLAAGTPVVCGSNDTTVEFFGVGAIKPGIGAVKIATSAVLFLAVRGTSVHPPISCYPHIVEGMYYTATGTNSCASAHRWLRDNFFLPPGAPPEAGRAAFAEMDRLAGEVGPGAEGLIFHPYLQGERAPYWDPLLRADFIGMTMQHNRAHFARALYEGIAYSIRDLLTAARKLGFSFGVIKLMGGGARSATWRQIIADVTGLVVERPGNGDASFGAALVAGIGVGAIPRRRWMPVSRSSIAVNPIQQDMRSIITCLPSTRRRKPRWRPSITAFTPSSIRRRDHFAVTGRQFFMQR